MDPATIASLAMGGTNLLGGLLGGGKGGGAAPNITKQDNTQITTLNVSVGGMVDAVRASLPFSGAVSASYATPTGYSADGYQMAGPDIMQTIQQNWQLIAMVIGGALLYRKLA